ncbi:MAG: hypothetical protein VYA84_05995 [Planctomycetota bacterium]|nr:hypothetical protein [Planctomycetota bacterium]
MVSWVSSFRYFGPIGSLLITATLFAESISLGILPPRPGIAGYVVDVAIETVGGNGYHPIHLTVSPQGSQFVRDRRLGVTIMPRNDYSTDLDFSFRTEIVVPQGATTYQTTVLVPQYCAWDRLSVRLSEDGAPVKSGGRIFRLNDLRIRGASQVESVGIVLAADADVQDAAWKRFPDARVLMTLLGDGPILKAEAKLPGRLSHQASQDFAKQLQPAKVQFRVLEENKLDHRWLAHSQLDILLVAAPILERIHEGQPASAKAIQQWVAAGGNLWVYANSLAPFDWLKADAFQIPARSLVPGETGLRAQLDLKSPNDTSPLALNGLMVMKESQVYSYARKEEKFQPRSAVFDQLKQAKHPFAEIKKPAEITGQLRSATYGLGTVITISDEDPFPGSCQVWRTFIRMHGPKQLAWTDRVGIDVPTGADKYWTWLIPSVGQPPVKAFVFLNTVFALMVGPVCYFYFRRRGRLYLLYFMAPLLALLMTLGIFGYALISDGVQTQVRTRQITWVDAASGYQLQQNRQTYFAASGREEGIRLPDDVALYPVQYSSIYRDGYYNRGMREVESEVVEVGGDRVHRGDFFPSRRQVQYLTLAVNEVMGYVRFSEPDSVATNELELNFEKLLVRDFSGKYWAVSNLAAGESQVMQPADQTALAELLGPTVLPPEVEVPELRQRSYFGIGMGGQVPGDELSLLESRLEQWAEKMPTSSFLGIAEPEQGRLGVDEVRILESGHVIMGRLP